MELSERMGIAPEEFLALLALRTQNEAVSLDTPVGEEGDTQLSDLLGSTDDRFERMEIFIRDRGHGFWCGAGKGGPDGSLSG